MIDQEQRDPSDSENFRRWRCPGCNRIVQVPSQEADPDLCRACEEKNKSGQEFRKNVTGVYRGETQNRRRKKKKGPTEDWCVYCQSHVSQWEKKSTGNGDHVDIYYCCPHCHKTHPYYKYRFLGFLGVFLGVGITIAVMRCTEHFEIGMTSPRLTAGVTFGLGIVTTFAFNHFMWNLIKLAAYRDSGPPESG